MSELKPCPFCGGEAELKKYYPPFSRRAIVTVKCTSCRCNSGEWRRSDRAIEAWNTRADEKKCGDCSRRKFYQIGYKDGINANRWIPCSERLPEVNENVLVACDLYEEAKRIIVTSIFYGCEEYPEGVWEVHAIGEPVAWMPLPEHYKGE